MCKLSIGKMAELNHVTEQTLRHYDKIGLLKPEYVDQKSKYRYYNIKQSARLDMIQIMKLLGMPLEKIKEQFEINDIKAMQQLLNEQERLINKKINELTNIKKFISIWGKNYKRYEQLPKNGHIELEHIPKRKIFCYKTSRNIYENNLEGYEYILRELKEHIILQHFPMIYFCNVGSITRKDTLNVNNLISNEIFLFVDNHIDDYKEIEYIPENDYMCIYCDSFWSEKKYAAILIDTIKKKNYEIVGDYICEVVAELPVLNHDERNMLIKLQIPIKTS